MSAIKTPVDGGRYRWSKNGDGTFVIFNVPIMAELKEGEKFAPFNVGTEWMNKCVTFMQLKAKENYAAPLHINHHDLIKGGKTERAGSFIPKRVGSLTLDGVEQSALFADLYVTEKSIFEKIRRGELPYLSVELPKWEIAAESPQIVSVALMADAAPWFKFEMLTLGPEETSPKTELFSTGISAIDKPSQSSVLAGCSLQSSNHILFRFANEGVDMMEEDHKKQKEIEKQTGGAAMMEEDVLKQIMERLTALEKAIGMPGEEEMRAREEKAEGLKPVEQMQAEEEEKEEEEMSAKAKADFAKLSAQQSALKQRMDARDQKEKLVELAANAENQLQAKGYTLSDETKLNIAKMAGLGPEAVKVFCAEYEASAPKDPPTSFANYDAAFSGRAATEKWPDEVMKFAADGEDALEQAKKLSRDYDSLGNRINASRAAFIKSQMGYEKSQRQEVTAT